MNTNRISENSCDKNLFDKAAPDYSIALKKIDLMKYHIYSNSIKPQTRKWQIIWFNHPYNANMIITSN